MPPPRKQQKVRQNLDSKESINFLIKSLQNNFKKQEKHIKKELKQREIPQDLAIYLFLSDFIHKSKHYTPRNIKETSDFKTLFEYFTTLKYAHCGQKPYALQLLLKEFNLESRIISYSDTFGWAHGFLEINAQGFWQILDPTFNLLFDIGVDKIIENPYCKRKILSLYSNEFYANSDHEKFLNTILDENFHTTFKYNKEWFSFMGFYPFVPPILTFTLVQDGKREVIYDIRKDSRYTFI